MIVRFGSWPEGYSQSDIQLYQVAAAVDRQVKLLNFKDRVSLDHQSTIGEIFRRPTGRNDYIYIAVGMWLRDGLICHLPCHMNNHCVRESREYGAIDLAL